MATTRIIERKLTDNSKVYDVRLTCDHGGAVLFHAVTKADAVQLVKIVSIAIENHTNETVEEDFCAT